MKDFELIGYLHRDYGIAGTQQFVADLDYSCPAADWFYGDFAQALGTFYKQLDIWMWTPENNDCDDFARGAAWFAQMLHHRTSPNRGTALAVGEFWYHQDTGSDHAIVIAVVKENDRYVPYFMEPQTQQRIKLSEKEIQSCSGYRF